MQITKPISVIFTLLVVVITMFAGYGLITDLLIKDATGNMAVISNISVWVFIIFLGAGTVFLTLFSENVNMLLSAFGVPLILGVFLLTFHLGQFFITMLTAIINAFPETLLAVIIIMIMYLLAFAIMLGIPIGIYFYLITR